MSRHRGFHWPKRRYLSQGELVPRDSEQLALKHAFQIQTNQLREHTPNFSSIGSHTGPVSPFSCHRNARYQQLGTASIPQSLLTLLKVANVKLLALRHLFLLTETTIKPLPHSSSLSLSPDQPHGFPVGPTMVRPFSWELWITNCLFNGKPLLISQPYYTSIFLLTHYILKHPRISIYCMVTCCCTS